MRNVEDDAEDNNRNCEEDEGSAGLVLDVEEGFADGQITLCCEGHCDVHRQHQTCLREKSIFLYENR